MRVSLIPGFIDLCVDDTRRDRFGGAGRLGGGIGDLTEAQDGRARVLNVPSRIDITVLEPITFTVVARAWSRPDGTWQVPYLNESMQFMVIGTDRSKQVNSAIQDWVHPAPMEP